MKNTMKNSIAENTMKNTIAVFLFLILVFAGSAFAWPWGNVGLNVATPEEQLDIGGNLLVRSNILSVGNVIIGIEEGSGGNLLFDMQSINGSGSFYGLSSYQDDTRITLNMGNGGAELSLTPDRITFTPANFSDVEGFAMFGTTSPVPGVVFSVGGVTWTNTP